jgi:hypothetical protein
LIGAPLLSDTGFEIAYTLVERQSKAMLVQSINPVSLDRLAQMAPKHTFCLEIDEVSQDEPQPKSEHMPVVQHLDRLGEVGPPLSLLLNNSTDRSQEDASTDFLSKTTTESNLHRRVGLVLATGFHSPESNAFD